jgi:hypothetical protein
MPAYEGVSFPYISSIQPTSYLLPTSIAWADMPVFKSAHGTSITGVSGTSLTYIDELATYFLKTGYIPGTNIHTDSKSALTSVTPLSGPAITGIWTSSYPAITAITPTPCYPITSIVYGTPVQVITSIPTATPSLVTAITPYSAPITQITALDLSTRRFWPAAALVVTGVGTVVLNVCDEGGSPVPITVITTLLTAAQPSLENVVLSAGTQVKYPLDNVSASASAFTVINGTPGSTGIDKISNLLSGSAHWVDTSVGYINAITDTSTGQFLTDITPHLDNFTMVTSLTPASHVAITGRDLLAGDFPYVVGGATTSTPVAIPLAPVNIVTSIETSSVYADYVNVDKYHTNSALFITGTGSGAPEDWVNLLTVGDGDITLLMETECNYADHTVLKRPLDTLQAQGVVVVGSKCPCDKVTTPLPPTDVENDCDVVYFASPIYVKKRGVGKAYDCPCYIDGQADEALDSSKASLEPLPGGGSLPCTTRVIRIRRPWDRDYGPSTAPTP